MYNLLKVIGVQDAARDTFGRALREATESLPGTLSSLAAPTLPGVYNGGDFLWRVSFADRAAAEAAMAGEAGRAIAALVAGERPVLPPGFLLTDHLAARRDI